MKGLAIIGALALAMAGCSTQAGRGPLEGATTMCGHGSPLTAADRRELCSALGALHEPRLPDDWMTRGTPVYRALLLIPGQPVTTIRVETAYEPDPGTLTVRRLSHGHIILDESVPLAMKDVETFSALVVSSHIEGQPLNSDAPTLVPCKVPSILVAEAYGNDQYGLTLSHCAAMRPLETFATGAYQFAAARLPELKQGLEQSLD